MDRLSTELKRRLRTGGTKSVIDHLEDVLRSSNDTEYSRIKDVVIRFIIEEQDELENCAAQLEDCLRKKGITVDDTNKIVPRHRKDKALEGIGDRWGHEFIEHYHWHAKRVHFLEDLASISRKTPWEKAVGLFNRVVLEGEGHGHWGRENHCAERPIQQAHLTKVLRHLSGSSSDSARDRVMSAAKSSGGPSILPLGRNELDKNGYEVDIHGLIIARSTYSSGPSGISDSIDYSGLLDPAEMIPQTDNADCTPEGLGNNADEDLDKPSNNSTEVISSGRSPQSWCTGGGPDVTNFEGPTGGPTAMQPPGTDKPHPRTADYMASTRSESSLKDLFCEKFQLLQQDLLENTTKVRTTDKLQVAGLKFYRL